MLTHAMFGQLQKELPPQQKQKLLLQNTVVQIYGRGRRDVADELNEVRVEMGWVGSAR